MYILILLCFLQCFALIYNLDGLLNDTCQIATWANTHTSHLACSHCSNAFLHSNTLCGIVSDSPCLVTHTGDKNAVFQSVQHACCSQSEHMSHHTPLLVRVLKNGLEQITSTYPFYQSQSCGFQNSSIYHCHVWLCHGSLQNCRLPDSFVLVSSGNKLVADNSDCIKPFCYNYSW